jgi:DNA-binding Lrp family transcriptional regulator
MMFLCTIIRRPISLKRKQRNNGNNRNNINTPRPKLVLGSLDAKIVEELLSDAFISSTAISKKHKAPLSTVQRRRRYLENTILTRRYEIDLKKQGFRIGEMTVIPENGSSKEVTNAIFSKYANNILSITVKIDGIISLAVLVYFKTTTEIHDIMAGIHSMPGVQRVKFAETVEIIRDKRSEIGKTLVRAIVR